MSWSTWLFAHHIVLAKLMSERSKSLTTWAMSACFFSAIPLTKSRTSSSRYTGTLGSLRDTHIVVADGKLPIQDALRCRVRYFTDGVVLGSSEFVEQVFRKYRDEFGRKRETGARSMRNGEWAGLCTMRDLRVQVISIATG